MPADPSIYRDVQPQPGPLANLSGALQVQQQLRQGQMQQQMQAQQALDQAMRSALNPDGSMNKDVIRNGIIQKGYGHLWPAIDEQLTKADKARADLAETQGKADALKLDYGGARAGSGETIGDGPGA